MHKWLIINDGTHYLIVRLTWIHLSKFLWRSFSPPPTKSCQQYSNSTPTLDGFVLWSAFHITKLWQGVFTPLASCGQCGTAWMNNKGTMHTNYIVLWKHNESIMAMKMWDTWDSKWLSTMYSSIVFNPHLCPIPISYTP